MDQVVSALKAARAEGKGAMELASISREELGPAFGAISFIASFRLAFGIPLPVLQRAHAWRGFGWGGVQISDEEFVAILSPWLIER
ncbi:hypothetical protein [Streptomyces sp. NPDC003077]|uniref:hypothetical protein n=1 Tax=Streptomyces sp. NPDC003077 TaxID=3154443 RepID=UPI0033A3EB0E